MNDHKSKPIIVIERESGNAFEEPILGEKWIRWAYQDAHSSLLERLLFRTSLLSKLMGKWYDSSLSRRKIVPTIQELGIDESEFAEPRENYHSFNDFFIRKLKPEARPFSTHPDSLLCPADGRLLVFPKLTEDIFIPVKGYACSLHKMLPGISDRFVNGALALIRLCPADYHRYHFPCAGKIIGSSDLQGHLHSVNPIALESGYDVFGENKRAYTLIETEDKGTIGFIEIGAFGVGSIVNTYHSHNVAAMAEKGYFKFGGSTIILVFEPNKISFSPDLIAHSARGHETLVKVGQDLGTKLP